MRTTPCRRCGPPGCAPAPDAAASPRALPSGAPWHRSAPQMTAAITRSSALLRCSACACSSGLRPREGSRQHSSVCQSDGPPAPAADAAQPHCHTSSTPREQPASTSQASSASPVGEMATASMLFTARAMDTRSKLALWSKAPAGGATAPATAKVADSCLTVPSSDPVSMASCDPSAPWVANALGRRSSFVHRASRPWCTT